MNVQIHPRRIISARIMRSSSNNADHFQRLGHIMRTTWKIEVAFSTISASFFAAQT
jgi:hypothetical protein